jgi:hypothetical protein
MNSPLRFRVLLWVGVLMASLCFQGCGAIKKAMEDLSPKSTSTSYSVSFNPAVATASLLVEEVLDLSVVVSPYSTNVATEWLSSAPEVVDVSPSGKITGKSLGSANISVTVTVEGHIIKKAIPVNVIPFRVTVSDFSDFLNINEQTTPHITIQSDTPISGITWEVVNDQIASVDQSGQISGLSPGETLVIASVTSESKTVTVSMAIRVWADVTALSLPVKSQVSLTGTLALGLTVAPVGANPDVAYSVSDSSLGSVSSDGIFTPREVGIVTVTARSNQNDAIFAVTEIKISKALSQMLLVDRTTNAIKRVRLDGSAAEEILAPSLGNSTAIEFSRLTQEAFWYDKSDGGIYKSSIDFSNPQKVGHGRLFEIGESGRFLYLVMDGGLYRSNLDGSEPTLLFNFTANRYPRALAIDEDNQVAYMTESSIVKSNFDGTEQSTIVNTTESLGSIAVDSGRHRLFWATTQSRTNTGTRIFQSDLNGNGAIVIGEDRTSARYKDLEFDSNTNRLYFIATNGGAGLGYLNLSQFNEKTILRNTYGYGIAVAYDGIYVTTSRGIVKTGLVDSPTEFVLRCRYPNIGAAVLNPETGGVYFVDGYGTLFHLDTHTDAVVEITHSLQRVYDLKLNAKTNELFFMGATAVKKIGLQSLIITDISSGSFSFDFHSSLVVDTENDKLYWSTRNGKIFESSLDGADKRRLVSKVHPISGIALDPFSGVLYYALGIDTHSNSYRIAAIDINSGAEGILRDVSLWIKQISLDAGTGNLYLQDEGLGRINTMDLDTKALTELPLDASRRLSVSHVSFY